LDWRRRGDGVARCRFALDAKREQLFVALYYFH